MEKVICPRCGKEGELIASEDGKYMDLNCSCTQTGPTMRKYPDVEASPDLSKSFKKKGSDTK
jgi:hypothetical protein